MYRLFLFIVAGLLSCGANVHAAWVEYQPLGFLIQASQEPKVLPGGTVHVSTALGPMYFPLELVKIHKAPSVDEQFERKERQAAGKKDPQLLLEAAHFALRRGLLRQYHGAIDKLLELDPNHAEAKRVKELKAIIDKGVPEGSRQREELTKLVRNSGMKFKASKHYLLMYDMPDTPDPDSRTKKTRAEIRLELLERVYESFLYKFFGQGVKLEVPKEPMKVVVFKEHRDYNAFASKLGDDMKSTAGFYEHTTNTAVFFDQGTHKQFERVLALDKQMQALKKKSLANRGPDTGTIVNLADTIRLIVFIARESQDVEVVSHEATHQLAANTGLLPKHVMIPSWVHEGLASYFEAPNDAAWAGFGAVNEQRLEWYRVLERDSEHSNIDFIVGDQIFSYARSNSGILHGYAQAWSLTHFLLEKRFDEFMAFYKKLGEMPPDTPLSSEALTRIFNDVFKGSRSDLTGEWRAHMNSLKTDRAQALGE